MTAVPVIHLAAAHTLRIPSGELAQRARERFGGELRRAGSFAQLSLLGVQQCRDEAGPAGAPGILWPSSRGALAAAHAALDEGRGDAPVMPFTFIATQPHLAAALLARQARLARAAFVHVERDSWPSLLHVAAHWLRECDEVLVGWVEEGAEKHGIAQSDWCLLRRRPAPARCEPLAEGAGETVSSGEGIARLAAWHAARRDRRPRRAACE